MNKSLGEKRVRVDFNPMKSDRIMFVKKEFAQLIDELETEARKVRESQQDSPETREQLRLTAIAQTKIEEAAMWMVKALT